MVGGRALWGIYGKGRAARTQTRTFDASSTRTRKVVGFNVSEGKVGSLSPGGHALGCAWWNWPRGGLSKRHGWRGQNRIRVVEVDAVAERVWGKRYTLEGCCRVFEYG